MSRRSIVRMVLATAVGAGLALAVPSVASAHATLQSSTPSANSVIETSPTSIDLQFDEEINATLATIKLFDANGKPVLIDPVRAGADATAITATVPTLANGLYAVVWKATSVDGHVVDGAFSFQIGSGATTTSGSTLISQVLTGPAVTLALVWAYAVARFLSMVGVVLVIGVALWSRIGSVPLHPNPRFAALRRWGGVVFVVGSLTTALFFAAQVNGGTIGDGFSASAWRLAWHTDTGRMLVLRIVASVVAMALVRRWQHATNRRWQVAAGATALAALLSFSASGHPNSLSPRWAWVLVDLVHMAAIVVWIGGLIALWAAPKAWLSEPEAVRPVQRFSTAATVCVPLIVLTGVLQTWRLAGGLNDVTATTWGRMLLAKSMLGVALVALGGVSRWLLEHEGAEHTKRTVITEAIIGVLVIALAAGIVSQSPRPGVPAKAYQQQLTANGVIASVTITPGHVGSNEVHILITPPGGSIAPVASATARVLLPSAAIPAAPVTLKKEAANHYSGVVTFPRKGDWTLEVIVGVTDSSSVQIKGTVSIP